MPTCIVVQMARMDCPTVEHKFGGYEWWSPQTWFRSQLKLVSRHIFASFLLECQTSRLGLEGNKSWSQSYYLETLNRPTAMIWCGSSLLKKRNSTRLEQLRESTGEFGWSVQGTPKLTIKKLRLAHFRSISRSVLLSDESVFTLVLLIQR